MANDKEKKDLTKNKRISSLLDFIQNGMKSMYRDTYQNQRTNNDDIDKIKDDITQSMNGMINKDGDPLNASNITRLYSRMNLKNSGSNGELVESVFDVFNDKSITDQILSSYTDNKYILDYDIEIDTVCKYMPRLDEALDAKKDNVLSADHFSKDYLTVKNTMSNEQELVFNKRIEDIMEEYKIAEFFEDAYDAAAKYGEQFVYIVPYKQAFKELLKSRPELGKENPNFHKLDPFSNKAVSSVKEMTIIGENGKLDPSIDDKTFAEELKDYKAPKLEVLFDKSGMLESAIINHVIKDKVTTNNKVRKTGLYESYINEMGDMSVTEAKGSFKISKVLTDELELPDDDTDKTANDGLVGDKEKEPNIKVPGCIVKKLKRENVIPIYVDDLCLGYYFLEFQDSNPFYNNSLLTTPQLTQSVNKSLSQVKEEESVNKLLAHVSDVLSKNIDANFINANQDLRNEIYMILKHNDIFNKDNGKKIKISFLPESDVFHIAWKKDPITHRGISDLHKSLLPAKLFACLYITNTIGILTRGQDKRVYYVKQSVDTNISKTMLNVISQIKQSNYNLRQMESLNTILNITGRFNDFVIPKNQNGESPIEFEVMQGQQIEYKTELMNALEEMAINGTDVPLELIQARQSLDYAIQLTMTNSKFLRKVYKRQAKAEVFFSQMLTRIYNCEFEENETIDVSLPAPAFLNMTNINQLMNNTNEYVQSIVNSELADESDEVKIKFTKKMMRYHLSTHMNTDLVDKYKSESKAEVKEEEELKQIETGGGEE